MIRYLLEKNLIPDMLIRGRIRKFLRQRLAEETVREPMLNDLIRELKNSPIAVETKAANEQHYEVPTAFYKHCLGKHLKYSACLFEGTENLDEAGEKMLALYMERAGLRNGMHILELGCGWGSLSLYMSEKLPDAMITAVSNSSTQKTFIDTEAEKRGIRNLNIITCDMNVFDPGRQYDRIISIEMFEHMRNYKELLKRISTWLNDEGKLFIHIFTHCKFSYKFEVRDESDWMSKYFFTGGIMPGKKLMYAFDEHMQVEKYWDVNGMHYGKTAEAWLENMDRNRSAIREIFAETYGRESLKWFVYWRIFFMACAELWNFNQGEEWSVSHYLFKKT